MKEEALDRNMWRTVYERGYGPAVRQDVMIMMMMMMMIEYHINPDNEIIFCIMRCVSFWSITGENQVE